MPRRSFQLEDSDLDEYQVKVINGRNNGSFIVKVCAGSGKSILALWKAKYIQDNNLGIYRVIVFTKALMKYMADGIIQVGIPQRNVDYYKNGLNRNGAPVADYIILDELGGEVNPQKLLDLLVSKYQNFEWKKSKKAWKNLRDKFMPSYLKTGSNAVKKGKEESSLFPSFFSQTKEKEKKLPFTDDNADEIISKVAKELNFDERVARSLTNDLKYTFDSNYRGNRSNEKLLKAFIHIVKEGKEQTTAKKGEDVSWKKELYKSLDSRKIEETILQICEF